MSKIHFDNECNVRRKKLSQLRLKEVVFPNNFRRNYTSKQLYDRFENKTSEELIQLSIKAQVAGRVMSQRIMGKASFITLKDSDGYIQLYVTSDALSKELYKKSIKQWDLGDILGVYGILFKTRTGALSIYCTMIRLLTKALRPLPSKFHGLSNQEKKYRQRYLDLIVNDKSKEIFKIRSLIIHEIRQFMMLNDFMEVETPMMHIFAGGATARPFKTHHNKLGLDMYLRIAPELYLKQLVIGGFERIFEINRNFRNEGVSKNHNPEFTMMEIYMTYADYHDLINLIQDLLCTLTKKILCSHVIKYGSHCFDISMPFAQMTVTEAIFYYLPETRLINMDNISVSIDFAKSYGIIINDQWNINLIHMAIFDALIINKIIRPTCVTSYPIEVSPLARRSDDNVMCADRFELFIAGKEIANGFSELNDPEEQKERFIQQIRTRNIDNMNYDNILKKYDEDYLIALEYGLPPTAGVGIGIDRLVMLLTNSHTIRDVILFPTLRPK